MKLSRYINFILELENVVALSKEESEVLDGFDESILILDDIADKSLERDGEPCFYITHGVENAKKEAKRLRLNAFSVLHGICKKRKLGFLKTFQANFLLQRLHKNILLGQKMDIRLQKETKVSERLLSIYERMVVLFTGGHIQYSFLLGFLIGNIRSPYKKQIASIGEHIGVLRQMDDDVKDYVGYHHEPLGDLVRHKKRLPELLFYLCATEDEKMKLGQLLLQPEQHFDEIKKLVLNEKVLHALEERVAKIQEHIKRQLESLPEKYQESLTELMMQFVPTIND